MFIARFSCSTHLADTSNTVGATNEADHHNHTLAREDDEPGAAEEASVFRAGAGPGGLDPVRRCVPGRERRPREEARGATGRGDDAVGGDAHVRGDDQGRGGRHDAVRLHAERAHGRRGPRPGHGRHRRARRLRVRDARPGRAHRHRARRRTGCGSVPRAGGCWRCSWRRRRWGWGGWHEDNDRRGAGGGGIRGGEQAGGAQRRGGHPGGGSEGHRTGRQYPRWVGRGGAVGRGVQCLGHERRGQDNSRRRPLGCDEAAGGGQGGGGGGRGERGARGDEEQGGRDGEAWRGGGVHGYSRADQHLYLS